MEERSHAALAEPRPAASAPIPDHARAVISSRGEPLDAGTRTAFESAFGHDFRNVRIHDDARASESAKKLDAHAYTIGKDIVLRSRGRDPELLAHELTHVVQQAGSHIGVQRKPWHPVGRTDFKFDSGMITAEDLSDPYYIERLHSMTRPELRSYRRLIADPGVLHYIDRLLTPSATKEYGTQNTFVPNPANIDASSTWSYWEQRVLQDYIVTPSGRMASDAEERDAVYAAFLSLRIDPKSVAAASSSLLIVPAAGTRKKELVYNVELQPAPAPQQPAAPNAPAPQPSVVFQFVSEHAGAAAAETQEPPAKAKPADVKFDADNLPQGAVRYFSTRAAEKRQIDYWIEQQRGAFDQIVTVRSPAAGGAAPARTLFRIQGMKDDKGRLLSATLILLPGSNVEHGWVPADYRARDFGDLAIENLQNQPHAALGDKLGHVDFSKVPRDEVYSVKYMLAKTWSAANARNTEVDVIVPIANTNPRRSVFYTFRFREDNEADVERIGEPGAAGTPASLDPRLLDITRVRGFEENSSDPAKFKSWLGKRYRGVKPGGATVADLGASVTREMAGRADSEEWFKSNYAIDVLQGQPTLDRLTKTYGMAARAPATDLQDFKTGELKTVELSLQTLTDTILQKISKIFLGRKKVARDDQGTTEPETAGETFPHATNNLVVLYDVAFRDEQYLFRGGIEKVNLNSTMTITHELGHVVHQRKPGMREAFNEFVKKNNIPPITDYAKKSTEKDFFTEAFALAQTDPEWLRQAHPDVYGWIDFVNRTGKVPKP